MDPAEIPLHDIHLPGPISWWPPAPGWWLVAGLLLLTLAIVALAWYWRRRRRVQIAALRELTTIESNYREHHDTHMLTQELSRLARRTALALERQRDNAATTGAAWTARLDELHKTGETDELIKTALIVAPYRRGETIDGDALLAAFRAWLPGLRQPREANK